jgi:hypothetical protein
MEGRWKPMEDDAVRKQLRAIRVYFRHNGLSIFALVASGVAAIYTYKQADIAQKSLVIGQRAFVHLESIELHAIENWVSDTETDGGVIIFNAPRNAGKMIRSTFSFTNAGNTPTKALQVMIHCEKVSFQKKEIGDAFELLEWDESKVIRRSIGAKQTISVSNDSCDLKNPDVLLNAKMRIVPVFLIGEVKYEDWIDPGVLHRTQFAHRLVVNDFGHDNGFEGMSVTTEPIGRHNCTDDDCPK